MKTKLINILNNVGKDKYMHADIAVIIAFITLIIASLYYCKEYSVAISFCVTTLVIIYKEAIDPKFCWKDIAAGYSLAIPTWIAYLM